MKKIKIFISIQYFINMCVSKYGVLYCNAIAEIWFEYNDVYEVN